MIVVVLLKRSQADIKMRKKKKTLFGALQGLILIPQSPFLY